MGRGNFEGGRSGPLWSIGHSTITCAKTDEPIVMLFGLWARTGPKNHEFDGAQIPRDKGQFWGKGRPL